jgi:hypothetical protein
MIGVRMPGAGIASVGYSCPGDGREATPAEATLASVCGEGVDHILEIEIKLRAKLQDEEDHDRRYQSGEQAILD